MDEKNLHGSIFKKLREERGYKLKDVAGDVISTRTLMRFEADETSISIAVFEKLLENCGIGFLDYLVYYFDNAYIENSEFSKKLSGYVQSGSQSKIVNECKKELKKNKIGLSKRIDILSIIQASNWREEDREISDNKRIIREIIESTNKLGWNEIIGLNFLIGYSSREEYSIEYIDRIIVECLQNIPVRNYLSQYVGSAYCNLLIGSLAFLSRNGYYELVEKRCKEAIEVFDEQSFLIEKTNFYVEVLRILATVYLRQNKKEGIDLANKVLKYKNIVAEITGDAYHKRLRDAAYKNFYEVNKTGLDIEF